jgi:hypothetical protein
MSKSHNSCLLSLAHWGTSDFNFGNLAQVHNTFKAGVLGLFSKAKEKK